MGRRSDHTTDELKQLAIEAGAKIIEERGYADFSARAVASQIGYSVGTLYHLFNTLDQFILHINASTLDLWYAHFNKALSKQKGHPVQILASAYINFCHANPYRWGALYEHILPDSTPIPEWYESKMSRLFALVEEALIPFAEKRHIPRTAKILWAGIHGLCVLSLSGKLNLVGAESAQVMAKNLIETYLVGLRSYKKLK